MSELDENPRFRRRRALSGAARLYAVQALYQMEAAGQSAERVAREFRDWRIATPDAEGGESPEADEALFERIVGDAVTYQARIDQATDRNLKDRWPLDRIDPVLRAVFRAAGAELATGRTPARVVMAEYGRVAGAFFADGPETRLVTAVLDAMAREAPPG
ncbi:transcription antitermination factor NusB [Paracoccus sp. S-4012]|uniref:transcription antitermination protein NusB n=1 Tax=Paracoccus sp. S-4012 TaxID=2665648 RepID=UPI0012B121D1|nr:transcription antitermination protein NusB [Paracoccus sp. S-4012]MRX51307.1 transcription antitermination factor NusB [Paracoccus sp. S-4012]